MSDTSAIRNALQGYVEKKDPSDNDALRAALKDMEYGLRQEVFRLPYPDRAPTNYTAPTTPAPTTPSAPKVVYAPTQTQPTAPPSSGNWFNDLVNNVSQGLQGVPQQFAQNAQAGTEFIKGQGITDPNLSGILGTGVGAGLSALQGVGAVGGILGGRANELPVVGPIAQAVGEGAGWLGGRYNELNAATAGLGEAITEPLDRVGATLSGLQDTGAGLREALQGNPERLQQDFADIGKAWTAPLENPFRDTYTANTFQDTVSALEQGNYVKAAQSVVQDVVRLGQAEYETLSPEEQLAASFVFDPLNFIPGLGIGEKIKAGKLTELTTDVGRIEKAEELLPKGFMGRFGTPIAKVIEVVKSGEQNVMLRTAFTDTADDFFGGLRAFETAGKDAKGFDEITKVWGGMASVPAQRGGNLIQKFGPIIDEMENGFRGAERALQTGEDVGKLPKTFVRFMEDVKTGKIVDNAEGTVAQKLLEITKAETYDRMKEHMAQSARSLFPIKNPAAPINIAQRLMNNIKGAEALVYIGLSPITFVKNWVNGITTMMIEGVNPLFNAEREIVRLRGLGQVEKAVDLQRAVKMQRILTGGRETLVGGRVRNFEGTGNVVRKAMGQGSFATSQTGAFGSFMSKIIKGTPVGLPLEWYSRAENAMRAKVWTNTYYKAMSHNWDVGKWIPELDAASQAVLHQYRVDPTEITNIIREAGHDKGAIIRSVSDYLDGKRGAALNWDSVAQEMGVSKQELLSLMDEHDEAKAATMAQEIAARVAQGEDKAQVVENVVAQAAHETAQATAERIGVELAPADRLTQLESRMQEIDAAQVELRKGQKNIPKANRDAYNALEAELNALQDEQRTLQEGLGYTDEEMLFGKQPAPATLGSVPFQITRDMRQQLYDMRYSREMVDKMTPQEATDILANGKGFTPPEAPAAPVAPTEPPPTPPAAPSAPPVAQEAEQVVKKPLPPMTDNYLKPLSEYTDTLYREADAWEAEQLLSPRISTGENLPETFMSNNPDLALGQGENVGYRFEFDSNGLQGTVSKRKPTWQFSYDQGDAEFVAKHNPLTTYRDNLKSVTVMPGAKANKAQRINIQDGLKDWTQTRNADGSITYRRPTGASTAPTAPVSALPEESPLPPQDLPSVQLSAGQQSAQQYLLVIKRADGTPVYTAAQLATWRPDTLERVAGELQTARTTFDNVIKAASSKGVATATATGAPNNRFLLNVLNKHKAADAERFVNISDVRVRADEAKSILDAYTPEVKPPTVPSGRVASDIPFGPRASDEALYGEMDNALKEIDRLREIAKEDEQATRILSRDEMVKSKARTQADLYEALYNLWNREDVRRVRVGSDAKNRVMAYLRRDVMNAADESRMAATVAADHMDNAVMISRDGETVFDAALGVLSPFQFWRSRFALQSLRRVADKPARLSWYLKLRNLQDQIHDDPRYPKRLRGKMFIPVPFVPDWAGGGMWFDPLEQATSLKQVFNQNNFEDGVTDQDIAASIRALAQRGAINQSEAANAIANGKGALWDQTKQRLMELASSTAGADSTFDMFRPHLPLDILWKLQTGNASQIGVLFPLTRIIRAATGVNIEQPIKAGLRAITGNQQIPDWDAWEAYRTDRALADMVGDGLISERDALLAQIERKGTFYEQAKARAQQQMSTQTFSVFGGNIFPKGEQAYYKASVLRNQLIDQAVASVTGGQNNETLAFLRDGRATHPDEADAQAEYDVMLAAVNGTAVDPRTAQLALRGVGGAKGSPIADAIAIAQSHLDAHLNALKQPGSIYDPYPGHPEKNQAAADGFRKVIATLNGLASGAIDPSTLSYAEKMELIKANGLNKKGTPLGDFYAQHPEWGARQDAFAEPEQRMKGFLTDEMWTRYNSLSLLDKRRARNDFPDLARFIVNPQRDYEAITIDQMAQWVKTLRGYLPESQLTPNVGALPQINISSANQSARYQTMQDEQKRLFNLDAMQPKLDTYGGLSPTDKRSYRAANPEVDAYFRWYAAQMRANPDLDHLIHPNREPFTSTAGSNDYAMQSAMRELNSNLNQMVRKIGDGTARRYHAPNGAVGQATGALPKLSPKVRQALSQRKRNPRFFLPRDVYAELLSLFRGDNNGIPNFNTWLNWLIGGSA